jgi:hypothetical protein
MLPKAMPACGIYLFSEGDVHLYVGRTGRLRQRLREHCRLGSTHNSAPCAFLLARDKTGMKASYRVEGSRTQLQTHEIFGPAFIDAKKRISDNPRGREFASDGTDCYCELSNYWHSI